MNTKKIEQGRIGEEYAASHLERLGYTIIDRNFRIRGGEIDIIAIEKDSYGQQTLVFIEVKTRSSEDYGTPLEAIGYYKLRTLLKAAQIYKVNHQRLPSLMRIDAVAVQVNLQNQLLDIELVKNISQGYN